MLRSLFLAHPRQCGESYATHARFALGVSGALFKAAFAALVHAAVPALFERTASRTVLRLSPVMASRQAASSVTARD
jgi:hypothetical protein